jgi:hypothetical protein
MDTHDAPMNQQGVHGSITFTVNFPGSAGAKTVTLTLDMPLRNADDGTQGYGLNELKIQSEGLSADNTYRPNTPVTNIHLV